ncbi:MAG: hypothetical protein ABR909_01425 [Candidatus Bathyarchaeia archaeon]
MLKDTFLLILMLADEFRNRLKHCDALTDIMRGWLTFEQQEQ